MTERERLESGLLFCPADPELKAIKLKAHKLSADYNRLYEDESDKRGRILLELLGGLGEGSFLQGPITLHYGIHTRIGKRCFFNFNTTIQDDGAVEIGDDCNFGPNLTIVTPMHPMLPDERKLYRLPNGEEKRLCYAKPVRIGSNCWFGANVTVCPGVTVGEGCVIGAGSVVTRDIPPYTFAAGNPCRVIRTLGDSDSIRHKTELFEKEN